MFIDDQYRQQWHGSNKVAMPANCREGCKVMYAAPLASLSCEVLKRQCQITAPHKPKNIPPHPPPTVERERETGRNNLLFRVLSEERQGCMLLYLCQRDEHGGFSELFCCAAELTRAKMEGSVSTVFFIGVTLNE